MSDAIVSISDVYPDTEKIVVDELRVGDVVFDAHGGRYPLKAVRILKDHVKTTRNDGWRDWWPRGSYITIQKRGA